MMKKSLALLGLVALTQVHARVEVIYGEDNRKDVYQVSDASHLKLARSTAGMIRLDKFAKTAVQGVFDLQSVETLEIGQNICPSEKFAQQVAAPVCSGFLVGPDTLVTAGHCYKSFATPEAVCRSFAWVFDYNQSSESSDPSKGVQAKNVYLCKQVVAAKLDATLDYAVIKLNRKVTDREPLKFRSTGTIANAANLVVIGHPSGLPLKISNGGKVLRNVEATTFATNLDTFHGNSGSAVFDASTGMIEGILIQGKNDYQPSKSDDSNSCMVVNQCEENGNNCSAGLDHGPVAHGEVVLRISTAASDIATALKMQ